MAALLLPLRGRPLGREAARRLRELEEQQWWPAERLATAQMRRLRRFLVDVGRHHEVLRRRFAEADFRPERVASPADLGALPLEEVAAREGDGGERAARVWDRAVRWRARRWWGVAPHDRVLTLPSGAAAPGDLDPLLDALLARRPPRALAGDGETLLCLARRAAERHLHLAGVGLRALFVSGASVDDGVRQEVEALLGAPLALSLTSPGVGQIGHSCPEGGLHLCADHLVVEVVDPKRGRPVRAGRRGELVVTDTLRRADPIVRRRTGLVGRRVTAPCLCGRGLPLVDGVATG